MLSRFGVRRSTNSYWCWLILACYETDYYYSKLNFNFLAFVLTLGYDCNEHYNQLNFQIISLISTYAFVLIQYTQTVMSSGPHTN